MRSTLLAFWLSLTAHAAAVVTVALILTWRGLDSVPQLALTTIAFDVKELPLGRSQPKAESKNEPGPSVPVRRPRPARPRPVQVAAAPSPDAGAGDTQGTGPGGSSDAGREAGRDAGGSRKRPGDLRSYGPEGSRLTALLRLDRLRSSSARTGYAEAIDQLLVLLPDRRRLLEGSGLDLFRDFDALLIATPEPRDDRVTFMAVRHHLKDAALQAALDRGALSVHHTIDWRTEGGRPVGVRRVASAADKNTIQPDDRLFVLPQPFLAVIAPPAYAGPLLGKSVGQRTSSDAGAPDAGEASGAAGRKSARISWSDLVARIDAEDSALPEDAVFMLTATNLIIFPGLSPVVPGTRGQVDDGPSGTIPNPQAITLVAGVDPIPYLELIAEFADKADARAWEREFPAWKRRLLINPVVLLAGFAPLLDRFELTREETTVSLRTEATAQEMQRLLALTANLAKTVVGRPRP
jgi:hypothetical protein